VIYTSSNSGATWTPRDANRSWQGIASSADGTRLAAVANDGTALAFTSIGGNIRGISGSASAPSYSFSADVSSGMFLPAASNIAFSTAGLERMRILSNGNVGIGTTTPSFQLQLSTDSAAKPTTSTWTVSSDQRIKLNIEDANVTTCYDTVKSLKLRRFEWDPSWNSDVEDRHAVGFIAQEVKSYFPKSVRIVEANGFSDFHSLDVDQIYKTMYGALVKTIRDIEILEHEVSQLKEQA
jgi:hypothetical protein